MGERESRLSVNYLPSGETKVASQTYLLDGELASEKALEVGKV